MPQSSVISLLLCLSLTDFIPEAFLSAGNGFFEQKEPNSNTPADEKIVLKKAQLNHEFNPGNNWLCGPCHLRKNQC